jgi:hypothetical protein
MEGIFYHPTHLKTTEIHLHFTKLKLYKTLKESVRRASVKDTQKRQTRELRH